MLRTFFVTLLTLLLFNCNVFASADVISTVKYQQPQSTLITYSGEVQLPFDGYWRLVDSEKPSQTQELYLRRDTTSMRENYPNLWKSKSTLYEEKERKIQAGSNSLQSLYYALKGYAEQHGLVGPTSLSDLDPVKDKRVIELNTETWTKDYDKELTGDFAFLVPGVTFSPDKTAGRKLPRSERKRLMIELHPYVDDGKHWILYNDGTIERERIDPAIIKQYGLTIQPIITKDQPKEKPPEFQNYFLVMVCPQDFRGPVSLAVENAVTGKSERIQWDFSQAATDEKKAWENLTNARRGLWGMYASAGVSPLLSSWLEFHGFKDRFGRMGNGPK